MQYFSTVSLSLSLLVFVVKQRAFFGFFFTPRSHAAESLPGFYSG